MSDITEMVRVGWTILCALVGGVVWSIYRVESKISKTECDKLRAECKACQRTDQNRLEHQFTDFRQEVTGRLDNITALIVERLGK
jgi:DNA-binding IscR family transcriptional regulator